MKRIVIVVGEEIMLHAPNGSVRFLTFMDFLKLAWWAIRNDVEVIIEDSK